MSRLQLNEGLARIADDPAGVVHTIPFRLARAFGVYWSTAQENGEVFEGRNRAWEAAGRWFHLLVVLPLVAVAVFALVARRASFGRRVRRLVDPVRLAPAAALFAVWVVGIVATYGSAAPPGAGRAAARGAGRPGCRGARRPTGRHRALSRRQR